MRTGILDWLILGGGVHGTHLSHVLTTARGVPADRIRVLDRESAPLANFWRSIDATGMTYLRSPSVHHIDLEPYSLLRFARKEGRRLGGFVPPYDRPRVTLFRGHCEHVVRRYGLAELRVASETTSIAAHEWGYRVDTSEGPLETRRLVLAVGAADALEIPVWARDKTAAWHVFHRDFSRHEVGSAARVAIVGGGISAAQLALALLRAGAQPILIARHPIREHRFDSDPEWLGPKAMRGFAQAANAARRTMIERARHRGSMPPELRRAIQRSIRAGRLRWIDAEVATIDEGAEGIGLSLDRSPHWVTVDHVALATGFRPVRPGGRLLDAAIENLGLPCAACGYPVVRDTLEWRRHLYVSGALAELEVGPTARNIAGARVAGERMARVAR